MEDVSRNDFPLAARTGLFGILEGFYLHQDDVVPNLLHIAEGDHILFFPPEYPAQASWPRDHQMGNASCALVKLHVPHKPQAFAVTDIDHFFFFKS